jgi:hypothetical protein
VRHGFAAVGLFAEPAATASPPRFFHRLTVASSRQPDFGLAESNSSAGCPTLAAAGVDSYVRILPLYALLTATWRCSFAVEQAVVRAA